MLPLCCRRKQYMALYALALALCTLGLIVHVSVGFPYSLNTDKLSDIDSSDGESRVFRRVLKSIRTKDDIDNGNIKDLQGKNFLKNINASHSNIDDAEFWSLNSSLPFDLWDFNVSRRQHDNSTTMPCTNSSNGPRGTSHFIYYNLENYISNSMFLLYYLILFYKRRTSCKLLSIFKILFLTNDAFI